MTRYTIDTHSHGSDTATSMADALASARRLRGTKRLYRGAEYQSDRPVGRDGDREYVTATDFWLRRSDATRQTDGQADVVISR